MGNSGDQETATKRVAKKIVAADASGERRAVPPANGFGRTRSRVKAPKDGLVLTEQAGVPRQRARRPDDWTRAMADAFVAKLAETCNVTLAAQVIGRSISNVYKRRAKDAGFRAAWDEAVAIGYSRLELMMLRRALIGTEKVVRLKNGESRIMRSYPDRIALALLRQHRETAAIAGEELNEDHAEACARIVARLKRLRERDAEEASAGEGASAGTSEDGDATDIEVKAAITAPASATSARQERHAMIGWGLQRDRARQQARTRGATRAATRRGGR